MLASTGGFELSSWGHRGRVPPEAAGRAVEALLGDPDAMILAHEAARISFRGADGLLDREQWDQPWRHKLWERLSDAGSRDVEKFARGVRAGRFLVCAVASLEWTIPGLALYGDASLHAWVNEVARELGVELIWTSVEAVHAPVDLGLPLASELPLDWGAAVVDASGFNFDQLPATADAEAIDLGDTALVELAPLRAWPKLRKVVLARLRPSSIAPILHVESLDFEASALETALGDPSAVRELTLRGVRLDDLECLRAWSGLSKLRLRGPKLGSLAGVEALGSIASLALELERLPDQLDALARLPGLERLRLHYLGEFDLRRLPALPRLRTLEISGLEDQGVQLRHPELLARFCALEELILTATDVATVDFVASLPQLELLRLDATEITDIEAISGSSRLRTLDLTSTYVTDLAPLGNTNTLAELAFSTWSDAPADLRALVSLAGLRRLDLRLQSLGSLRELASLRQLECLSLDAPDIADLRPLADHPSLRSLELFDTCVTDLGALAGLGLSSLALSTTEAIELGPLTSLPELRSLMLHAPRLDLAPLASIPLVALRLGGEELVGTGALVGQPIESLDVSGTSLADCSFVGTLAHLRALDLSQTPITSLAPLTALRRLRRLSAWALHELASAEPLLSLPPLAWLRLDARLARPIRDALEIRHHLELVGE